MLVDRALRALISLGAGAGAGAGAVSGLLRWGSHHLPDALSGGQGQPAQPLATNADVARGQTPPEVQQQTVAEGPGGIGERVRFEAEEQFAAGDRCVVRWRYEWGDSSTPEPHHVRGIDVFRVRDGLVAEKVCYVKG